MAGDRLIGRKVNTPLAAVPRVLWFAPGRRTPREYLVPAIHQPEGRDTYTGSPPLGILHVGIVSDDTAGRRVFLGDLPRALHSDAPPYSPRFYFIGSQDLDVKSHPNIFTLRSMSTRIPPSFSLAPSRTGLVAERQRNGPARQYVYALSRKHPVFTLRK
ncbi:hypothetical protein PR048_010141 [Dryococelus australis]|uniref:Uncharacterized protein n=1 Tax=Dryococelus australis TaxID=614101 RepID=A0ABQ9I2A9_9NEOP|nr:hypothetical protein PR048_010141 [Dryococelus australis]